MAKHKEEEYGIEEIDESGAELPEDLEDFEAELPDNLEDYDLEEVKRAMVAMKRTKAQQAKQRDKLKNDPEAKAKAALRAKRQRVKDQLLKKKALENGITVSDAEVEAAMVEAAMVEAPTSPVAG